MPGVVSAIDIQTPPEKVWELMCDPQRYPDFVEATDRMVFISEEPMAEGFVYREYGGLPPFKSESEWRVTLFEPISRQVHVGDDGSMRFDLDILVAPTSGGCRLTMNLDLTPKGLLSIPFAVLWPLLMKGKTQGMQDRTVANVKRALEAEAVS